MAQILATNPWRVSEVKFFLSSIYFIMLPMPIWICLVVRNQTGNYEDDTIGPWEADTECYPMPKRIPRREVTDCFQCSQTAVSLYVKRQLQTSSHSNHPKSQRTWVCTDLDDLLALNHVLVRDSLACPFAIILELCARWNEHRVTYSNSTMRRL